MSRKYFLFSGLAVTLVIGLAFFVTAISELLHLAGYSDSSNVIFTTVEAFAILGLTIPAYIFAIKALKEKKDNNICSVLLLIAAFIIFVGEIYIASSFSRFMKGIKITDKYFLYYFSYICELIMYGLFPVVLAILSLFRIGRKNEDYVPIQKAGKIAIFSGLAILFLSFLQFSTNAARGISIYESISSGQEYVVLAVVMTLVTMGLGVPSFFLAIFKRKNYSMSAVLLLIAAAAVTVYEIYAITQTRTSDSLAIATIVGDAMQVLACLAFAIVAVIFARKAREE